MAGALRRTLSWIGGIVLILALAVYLPWPATRRDGRFESW